MRAKVFTPFHGHTAYSDLQVANENQVCAFVPVAPDFLKTKIIKARLSVAQFFRESIMKGKYTNQTLGPLTFPVIHEVSVLPFSCSLACLPCSHP